MHFINLFLKSNLLFPFKPNLSTLLRLTYFIYYFAKLKEKTKKTKKANSKRREIKVIRIQNLCAFYQLFSKIKYPIPQTEPNLSPLLHFTFSYTYFAKIKANIKKVRKLIYIIQPLD